MAISSPCSALPVDNKRESIVCSINPFNEKHVFIKFSEKRAIWLMDSVNFAYSKIQYMPALLDFLLPGFAD